MHLQRIWVVRFLTYAGCYDGTHLLQYLINDPPFPDPNAIGPTNIVRLDPTVKIPYVIQYGVGLERQLQKSTTLAVNYYGTRGVDLLRARDVNAPPPPYYIARPNPNYGVWRQIESSGSLEARLRADCRSRCAFDFSRGTVFRKT
jgi:hypothetical protein